MTPDAAVAFEPALLMVSVDINDKVEIDIPVELEKLPEEVPFAMGPLSKGKVRLMSMACVSPVVMPAMLIEIDAGMAPLFAVLMISEACGRRCE